MMGSLQLCHVVGWYGSRVASGGGGGPGRVKACYVTIAILKVASVVAMTVQTVG